MASSLPPACLACSRDCLHRLDLMAGLPEEQQRQLMRRAVHRRYAKGETLFETGDRITGIYLLHTGRVKLTNFDAEGCEQIVGIFRGGETLWEDLFLPDARYPYTGICLEETEVCRLNRDAFAEALRDARIALQVVGLLSRKLHDANERNRILATQDPLQRLSGFLLTQSRHMQGDTVTLRLEDIAGSICARPETVSRKIRELETRGLVRRTGQSGIRILDSEGLKTLFEKA